MNSSANLSNVGTSLVGPPVGEAGESTRWICSLSAALAAIFVLIRGVPEMRIGFPLGRLILIR